MASLLWTKNQNCKSNNRAPSSIFSSNSNLSPRQIATKACSLAIKKLDRDDKRSRPQYNVRERLLLCNTLSTAEKFLQKRTHRTNRRVMAFEEEEDMGSPTEDMIVANPPQASSSSSTSSLALQDSTSHHHHHHYDHTEHHSPLCQIEETDDEEEEDLLNNQMTPTTYSQEQQQEQQQAQLMTLEMALQLNSFSSMDNNAFVIPQDDEDFLQYPSSFLIPNKNSTVLSSDCRPLGGQQNAHSSRIASII